MPARPSRPVPARVSPPQAPRSRSQTGLSAELEGLLIELVEDGFAVYCCGARATPHALVASYEWDCYADLASIRDFDRITTARVPTSGEVDLFAPEVAVWAYEGPPQLALRALLDLPHPTHPLAPTSAFPAPPALHIPRGLQRPMAIKLPAPDRTRRRAVRLTTAMEAYAANRGS